MEIKRVPPNEKTNGHLEVYGKLKFDYEECFCEKPYMFLLAYKERQRKDNGPGWKANTIGIAIHDKDDYDVGVIYRPNPEDFLSVLHELINWMNDLENGIIIFDDYVTGIDDFFPHLGCEREYW